jgi:uncharacterized membrane protein YfcA
MGVLGGGGSVLGIPLLRYGFDQEPAMAIGISLLVVGIGSVIGTVVQMRHGAVALGVATTFGGAGMVGAFLASKLARFLPGELQLVLFAILVLGSSVVIIRPGKHERPVTPEVPEPSDATPPRIELMVVSGFAMGMVTGLLGLGGGFLLVPAFVLLAALPMHRAVATAMPVVAVNSLAGATGYMTELKLPWAEWTELVLPFLAATCVATIVGANLSHRLPAKWLRVAYVILLVTLGGLTLVVEGSRLWAANGGV